MPKRGYKIVIEGLDGAGGETQSKILLKKLRENGYKTKRLTYPDYGGPIGNLIHKYLHKIYNFPAEVQFLLYSGDMIKDKERINKAVENGEIIIFDRYITSTMAYQGLKGFPIKKALKYIELFEMPKPDLIIYLDISPETSLRRKYKEKEELDRFESDKEFLKRLRKFYQKLIDAQVLGKWIVVNGEKTISEVTDQIVKTLKDLGIEIK